MTAVQHMIEDLKQMSQIPSSLFDKYLIMESEQMMNAFFAGWNQCDATSEFKEENAKEYLQEIQQTK
jgi:hypothetical protein